MNLLAPLLAEAADRPHRVAIIAPRANGQASSATFEDLMVRSAQLASAWHQKGIRSGDRILLAMPLGIPLYASLIALWRLGAVVVLPEPALGLAGLRHALSVIRPNALLVSGLYRAVGWLSPSLWSVPWLSPDDFADPTVSVEPVEDSQPALISFTSGSTGRPKTIVRNHGFLRNQNACVANLIRPRSQDEIDLVAFPVFVLANLALGVTSVLPDWNLQKHHLVDPVQLAHLIERHRITRAMVPPSVCERMCEGPDLPLEVVFTGGGPVFPDVLERLAAKVPAAKIVAVYGSTEAEPIAHLAFDEMSASDLDAVRNGSGLLVGQPVPGIRLQLINDEIVVTGDHVNKGYLDSADNLSTKVEIDGEIWHRTGDAGRLDKLGRLWLLGRVSGKANGLFPFCVETASRQWPGVKRSALVEIDGEAFLAIEAQENASGQQAIWQSMATKIGQITVVPVKSMPLDRRHRSKIDYPSLLKVLRH